jgi:hypothetical protein
MTIRGYLGLALTLTLAALGGCDEAGPQKGSVGESCQKRDDCGGGLSCVDNRCVEEKASTGNDGGMERVAGGQIGESCTRRGDCQAGLACFDQVCMNDDLLGDAGLTDTRGDRGESCAARNDCRPGLACVNARCRQAELELTATVKECFRVDCQTAADCCVGFVPQISAATCALYKSACDLDPLAAECTWYQGSCTCDLNCVESPNSKGTRMCTSATGCTVDDDCFFSAPYCVNSTCVECKATADCAAEPGTQCVSGTCRPPCTRNEQCPLFYACQAGACVDVGCTSDRECAFATDNPLSKCVNKECATPCTSDSECMADFNVCEAGRCVFVGCESDVECRAYFGYANYTGPQYKAVCKMPDP